MNRLPVTDKKIMMILDFLKLFKQNAYTRRQIAEYLWDNYSFPDYKTFDQVLREVGEKLLVHVRNKDTEIKQIVQYNTRPYTYQFVCATENTPLEKFNSQPDNAIETSIKIEPQLSLDELMNEEVVITTPIPTDITPEETVELPAEVDESVLVEDIKACDKVTDLHNYKSSLIHWLDTSTDRKQTLAEIQEIVEKYA